jgi:5-methylcytosine-specific restriction endonuclease McrA
VNRWNIPDWLEREVVERDGCCVYCGVEFSTDGPRQRRPSWEHIVNDARIVTRENIARCCIPCNASKGAKELAVWLRSKYCIGRGITEHSVAAVVKAALR